MELKRAVKVFVYGFAAWRSRTHPYVPRRVGPLWLIEDAPRPGKNPKYRGREFVACGSRPATVLKHVASVAPGAPGKYALCAIHPGGGRDAKLEAEYKALGMRYAMSEPIFVRASPPRCRPGKIPRLRIERVNTVEGARGVAEASGTRQLDEAQVEDDHAAARLYAAFDGDTPVGWVSSIRVQDDAAWVSNLYVVPEARRRGVGRALMRTMLHDDVGRGLGYSVLTASSAGAYLYPQVGYERVGTLQLFRPPKDSG